MRANDARSTEATCHGAYVCLNVPSGALRAATGAAVTAPSGAYDFINCFE